MPVSHEKHTIVVCLPEAVKAEFVRMAVAERRTISNLARIFIEDAIKARWEVAHAT
jgi:hypothetical protein